VSSLLCKAADTIFARFYGDSCALPVLRCTVISHRTDVMGRRRWSLVSLPEIAWSSIRAIGSKTGYRFLSE
jgi:hypothetical protein